MPNARLLLRSWASVDPVVYNYGSSPSFVNGNSLNYPLCSCNRQPMNQVTFGIFYGFKGLPCVSGAWIRRNSNTVNFPMNYLVLEGDITKMPVFLLLYFYPRQFVHEHVKVVVNPVW